MLSRVAARITLFFIPPKWSEPVIPSRLGSKGDFVQELQHRGCANHGILGRGSVSAVIRKPPP